MRNSLAILIAVLFGASATVIADNLAVDKLGFDEIVFVIRKPYSSDH